MHVLLLTEWRVIITQLTDIIFFHLLSINGDRKSQELHLSTCIQLRMTKYPSRKVMNFRHLLGCDTIADNITERCQRYKMNKIM